MAGSPLFHIFTRERNFKGLDKVQKVFESFSITEKAIFLVASAILTIAVFSLLLKVNSNYMVEIPSHGGTLVEGIVGTPRFINPLLASSDTDRDISSLVYSGLLKESSDGILRPDLAESFTISPDGLVYTFKIRTDAKFHDGKPVTSDDVEFTIQKAQDPNLKSPRRVNWDGVEVSKPAENTIVFTLKQPYQPFISNLTLGILPKHIWKDFGINEFAFSSVNLNPIGSGPYKVGSVEHSKEGIPVSFTLVANSKYTLGEPYISNLVLKFFQNDKAMIDAMESGDIDSASNVKPEFAESAKGHAKLVSAPFTRIFGIFFNQNQAEIFAHKEVRQALAASVDKQAIIDEILFGYGTVIDSPLPLKNPATTTTATTTAKLILTKAGWKKNDSDIYEYKKNKTTATTTLAFTLSTANIPELADSARAVEEDWNKLGANVDVRVFESSDLNQSIIRPRKYDALLFGIVIGKNPDLYPFWHSSQRNDPGLNIALYTNTKADTLLEKIRRALDQETLNKQYADFAAMIAADIPAVFLWSPDFIYAVPENIHGMSLGAITTPSDRFLSIQNWYLKTDKVWKVFVKDTDKIIN